MVWAAEFVRSQAAGSGWPQAACWAARAVEAMQRLVESTMLDPPAQRMLDDMLGTGENRTGGNRAPVAMPIPGGGR